MCLLSRATSETHTRTHTHSVYVCMMFVFLVYCIETFQLRKNNKNGPNSFQSGLHESRGPRRKSDCGWFEVPLWTHLVIGYIVYQWSCFVNIDCHNPQGPQGHGWLVSTRGRIWCRSILPYSTGLGIIDWRSIGPGTQYNQYTFIRRTTYADLTMTCCYRNLWKQNAPPRFSLSTARFYSGIEYPKGAITNIVTVAIAIFWVVWYPS